MTHTVTLRRHAAFARTNPKQQWELKAEHPAVVEKRPLFPSTVVTEDKSPRLLVSGHNSRKIGKRVLKGEWKGMPIFTLTLAERTTCPEYCPLFKGCYGNGMHYARRHLPSPQFEARLVGELLEKSWEHPKGFVVRLHVLGDFYSNAYALLWLNALNSVPELHVFGYTARRVADELVALQIISQCNAKFPARCHIRISREPDMVLGPMNIRAGLATVVDDESQTRKGDIICPAQLHKSECCATCGLCWSQSVSERRIVFLKHGPSGARKKSVR